jgi:hypothetical protein
MAVTPRRDKGLREGERRCDEKDRAGDNPEKKRLQVHAPIPITISEPLR